MNDRLFGKKLKAELDFFKVYAVFIIGLVTGNINILLKYLAHENTVLLLLLILGVILLFISFGFFVKSYLSINKLWASLKTTPLSPLYQEGQGVCLMIS